MRIQSLVMIALMMGAGNAFAAEATICPDTPQHYQEAYEVKKQQGDIVCYKEALQRELNSKTPVAGCNASAEFYQKAVEANQRASDIICMQQAIKRENAH